MGRDIVLDTPRGAIGAWRADPVAAPRGGLVVVQELYGVNAHIRSVADRYAAEGYVAIAPAFSPLARSRPAAASTTNSAASSPSASTSARPREVSPRV